MLEQFNSQSLALLEGMYETYLQDPTSVDSDWRDYFDQLQSSSETAVQGAKRFQPDLPRRSMFNPSGDQARGAGPGVQSLAVDTLQERVDQLIRNFRVRGHIMAAVDPLGRERPSPPELDPAFYGFTADDYDRPISTSWFGGPEVRPLRSVIAWLKTTYCRSIGAQFMHIDSLSVRQWLQLRMEETANHIKLTRDEQIRILSRLSDAVVFEEFIQKKFVGAKSFSLEGAESLIPLLDMAIEKAGNDGIREIVLGMAHRGRLNVLANIMGKSPRMIFREFEDRDPELHIGRGDVKYHLGFSSDWTTSTGKTVHLSLCFNPSHLEFVNPVALGRMRSKQDRVGDSQGQRGMVFLIHGDAAFAGEGVVQETLNLSELAGYRTGGTIHIIVNNQIGFTTSECESRSTTYATDVAKMLQSPIFHVNGEDPEAVAQVVHLAMDFRREFHRDVVIDMYCFRRRGHNEGDEPEFTQPTMYRAIKDRSSVFEAYRQQILQLRGLTRDEAEQIMEKRKQVLEDELAVARRDHFIQCVDRHSGLWLGYRGGDASEADIVDTKVAQKRLSEVLHALCRLPEDFSPHPKIERILSQRREMADGQRPLDWGTAEMLAFGTLVTEGTRLRMSGQDSQRGTFSQRHSVLHDYRSGETYMPLKHLSSGQAPVDIINSPLSEAGVLGFDYGYSLDCPDGLIIWEAQFGDFSNAAQVIIDQFIASAEDKWDRLSGIVMLLPHGFEGQGPEHSSGRIERFLMLAADDNMQVVYPTTPAQHFHVLRRQVLRRWKKPLIVFTPKSLLRHKDATSQLSDLATSNFQPVIADPVADSKAIRKILLCSGKVYYDLAEVQANRKLDDITIIRIEELYPLPIAALEDALADFPEGTPVCWVQEEPENMGAWRFIWSHLASRENGRLLGRFPLSVVCRPASASPATGSATSHKFEQRTVLHAAFDVPEGNAS